MDPRSAAPTWPSVDGAVASKDTTNDVAPGSEAFSGATTAAALIGEQHAVDNTNAPAVTQAAIERIFIPYLFLCAWDYVEAKQSNMGPA